MRVVEIGIYRGRRLVDRTEDGDVRLSRSPLEKAHDQSRLQNQGARIPEGRLALRPTSWSFDPQSNCSMLGARSNRKGV